jgi:RNA polymerase sigma-70 factor (ECF subfamily)
LYEAKEALLRGEYGYQQRHAGVLRMIDSPPTRASLLLRLRDPKDQEAWQQFLDIYSMLIYRYARKRGLQDADAADLMQEVLRSVSSAIGRLNYDSNRGSFRNWLYTITRNKLHSFLDRQRRQVRGSGDSGIQQRLEEEALPEKDSWWEQEYEQRLFEWAAERVHRTSSEAIWQAFWQTAVEGKSPKDVAHGLGMSVGSVYVAKSRVLALVREQIRQVHDP